MSGAGARPESVSPERILGRALILRAKCAAALAKAAALPPEFRSAGETPSRDHLLRQLLALHQEVTGARGRLEKLEDVRLQGELLEQVTALKAEIDRVLSGVEQVVTDAHRETLLREVLALKASVANTTARLRLVPGILTI